MKTQRLSARVPVLATLIVPALLLLAACSDGGAKLQSGTSLQQRLRVADAAMAGGLPQAALNATRGALESDPGNIQALLQQGDALAAMGRGDAAEEAFRRVLALNSATAVQSRRAWLGVARADLGAGRAEAAEAAYRTVLATAPADPSAHDGLGISLDLQGRHAEAQAEYRVTLTAADNDGARVNLGLSLAMSGDAAGAVAVLGPLARDPAASRRVRHNLAFALALAGDRNGAERILAPDMPSEQVVVAMASYESFRTAYATP
jgi:Flp pilus assembly protein TadD